eukprot:CAMPEP_0183725906 /NCGR_PEP_ID=MMETSP0737-20130205/21893_1 /TAXON_ID=385413 /ORGANISM="Thalassiosira miniscula, Strain CCMP1093" /LENGTH=245 /DNA_ID=CAMNT_0025957069 /DNA_START=59 /DNA_END=796 /DNA_ORIENTATION=-
MNTDNNCDDEIGRWIWENSRKGRAVLKLEQEEEAAATAAKYEHERGTVSVGVEDSGEANKKAGACLIKSEKCKSKSFLHEGYITLVSNEGVFPWYALKKCSHKGCTNRSHSGGVCKRHGAKLTECFIQGCTNHVRKGGICEMHGGKRTKCSHEGCTNNAQKGGVCIRHGAKPKTCNHEGCTRNAKKGGLCKRHGAGATFTKCSHEGCSNYAQKGQVCGRHWAKREKCNHDGFTKAPVVLASSYFL